MCIRHEFSPACLWNLDMGVAQDFQLQAYELQPAEVPKEPSAYPSAHK